MKGWKKWSLYHVLKNRLECKFSSNTLVDFYSGISRVDGLSQSLSVLSFIVGLALFYNTAAGLLLSILTFVSTYWTLAIIVSAVDTYYMRKMRIRRETIKSVELMIGMVEKKRWP